MDRFRVVLFIFLFSSLAVCQSNECDGLSQAECKEYSGCHFTDVTDGEKVMQCVSRNCRSISLNFELKSPYGCPPEFCTLGNFQCINKSFLDTLVEGVFAAENQAEVPIRYLFWCIMLCLAILLVLLKLPRILAYVVSNAIWFFYLRMSHESRYNSSIYIGSFTICLLGGKIKINNVEFMSIDQNISISEVIFSLRWWLPSSSVSTPIYLSKSTLPTSLKPARLSIYFKGVEVSIYNNSSKFNELQTVLQGDNNQQDKDHITEYVINTLIQTQFPWFYRYCPLVAIHGQVFCLYLGEPRLPSSLVFHVAKVDGTHFAIPIPEHEQNTTADCYRTKNKFILEDIQLKTVANQEFKGVSSLQASLTEVLLGKTGKHIHGEGTTKILGVVREFVSYVKDIFDEEVMFTPPDFSVGLTGGDFQEAQRNKDHEEAIVSDSDEGSASELSVSRNSSFRTMWKSSKRTLPYVAKHKRRDSFQEKSLSRRLFNCTRWTKDKILDDKPAEKAIKSDTKTALDNTSVVFSCDKVFLSATVDIPGPKLQMDRTGESQNFDGFPKLLIEAEIGSEESEIIINYGSWHNMLRGVFQDRFLPDILQSVSYDFSSLGVREHNEIELKVVTKGKTIYHLQYNGDDPETLVSQSAKGYRYRGSVETGKLYASLAEPLDHLRHGKKKQTRAPVEVTTPSATQELRSVIFDTEESTLVEQHAAWNNIDWLATSSGLYLMDNWQKVLRNILRFGWVLDEGLLEVLELREQYLDLKSLSKFQVKEERQKLIAIRFYQASLLTMSESILKKPNKHEILSRLSLLQLSQESESPTPIELAKQLWSNYSCQDQKLVKELKQMKRSFDRSLLDTFLLAAKGLPLSPLFEERMSSSKMFRYRKNITPGTEISYIQKALKRAGTSNKFESDIKILEETLPLLETSTARLPRWLNIFGPNIDFNKTSFLKKRQPAQGHSSAKEKESYSQFISPQHYAESNGRVLKHFSISFEKGSIMRIVFPFFSIDGKQTTSTYLFELKDFNLRSSQTDSDLLRSPAATLKWSMAEPLKRNLQVDNFLDFQFSNSTMFYLREHDVTVNELLLDWGESSSLVNLRRFDTPELFMPQRYSVCLRAFETCIFLNVNEQNVVDMSNNLERNKYLKMSVPTLEAEVLYELNDFESVESIIEWNCTLCGNKDWKTACLVSLVGSHNKKAFSNKADPVCMGFDSMSLRGKNASSLVVEEALFQKRNDISCVTRETFINCYPETIVALQTFVQNYVGAYCWTITSGDHIASRYFNLRSVLGQRLLDHQISKDNPPTTFHFTWQNEGLNVYVPLTKFPSLDENGNVLRPDKDCFRMRNLKSTFCVEQFPRKSFNLSIQATPLIIIITEASKMGVKTIPDKSTGNINVSFQESTDSNSKSDYGSSVKHKKKNQPLLHTGNHTSDHKGKIVISSISYKSHITYKAAAVSFERGYVVPYQEHLELKLGTIKGDFYLAQLQGILRGLSCFQIGLSVLKSRDASIGGQLCRSTLLDLSDSVPSYQAILGKSLVINPAIVKCYVGTMIVPNFNKHYSKEGYSFYFEARMDNQVFRSQNRTLKNNQGCVSWDIMYSFVTTKITSLTLIFFAQRDAIKIPLGKIEYLPDSLSTSIKRNTANLGTLLDNRGLNYGQIKNSLRWCYLSPDSTSNSLVTAYDRTKLLEAKIEKLNQTASTGEMPLHSASPVTDTSLVGLVRHTRKHPIRVSLTLSGCEVFPVSFVENMMETEKDKYISRCFRFTANVSSQGKPAHEPDMAQLSERRSLLRRISRFDNLPNASQTIALSLYTQEALKVVASEHNDKVCDLLTDDIELNFWSPRVDSLIVLKVSSLTLIGNYSVFWKFQSDKNIVLRCSRYNKMEDRRRRKFSFPRDMQSIHFLDGSNWLQVSDVQVKSMISVSHKSTDVKAASQRKAHFQNKMVSLNSESQEIPLKSLLEGNVKDLFGCIPKLHLSRHLESKDMMNQPSYQISYEEEYQSSDDSDSFCSAVETRAAELKQAFRKGFTEKPSKETLQFSVHEPLPLSPGSNQNEAKFLERFLPKYRLYSETFSLTNFEIDTDFDFLDTSEIVLSKLAAIEETNLVEDCEEVHTLQSDGSDDVKVTFVVSGFLTSALLSFVDDAVLVVQPVTPTLQHIFDKAYRDAFYERFSRKGSSGISLHLEKLQLSYLQVSPLKTNRAKTQRQCVLRGDTTLSQLRLRLNASQAGIMYEGELASYYTKLSSFGYDLVKKSDRWCSIGRGLLENVVIGCESFWEETTKFNLALQKFHFKLGSDSLCALHSFLIRIIEEALAVRDTYNAVEYRSRQQWAIVCGQIVKLMYSVSQHHVASSSQVKHMKRLIATKKWNKDFKPYDLALPIEEVLLRLKTLLEVVPERSQIEGALANIPFNTQPDLNDLPVEFLTNVAFLKAYFNKQTWTDSMKLKPESIFVNKLFSSFYLKPKQENAKSEKLVREFCICVGKLTIQLYGKTRSIPRKTTPDLEFEDTKNLAMKLNIGQVSFQLKDITNGSSRELFFGQTIESIRTAANPQIIELWFTLSQIGQSFHTLHVAYTTLGKVRAKYHDSMEASRTQMESLLPSDTKLVLEDDARSVAESVVGEGLEKRSNFSVEEYDIMSWENIKRDRRWKAELEWRKSMEQLKQKRKKMAESRKKDEGSGGSSGSTATTTIENRSTRAETLTQGKIRRIARLSYEETQLSRLIPTASLIDDQTLQTSTDRNGDTERIVFIFGKFNVKKISLIFATTATHKEGKDADQTRQSNPILSASANDILISVSQSPSAVDSLSPAASIFSFDLKRCCSTSVSNLKFNFGRDLSKEKVEDQKPDIQWVANGIVCFASEGCRKKAPLNNMVHSFEKDMSEFKVFMEVESSTIDLSNWQISSDQFQIFVRQWGTVYRDLRREGSINKNFVARQNYFVHEISAEGQRVLSSKNSNRKPVKSWRVLRENMYVAAKNTTASVEKYLVDGLTKADSTTSRFSFCCAVSGGMLKLSPTNSVCLEYRVSKLFLDIHKQSGKELGLLFNVGRSQLLLDKVMHTGQYFRVVKQDLPSFWIHQRIDTAGYIRTNKGKKVYEFDLKIIVQKIETELAPTIVEDIVSLQSDLADEILATLAILSKLSNQYKGQNVSEQKNNDTSKSLSAVPEKPEGSQAVLCYRLMFFVEGINIKIEGAQKAQELAWIDADSGGVQLSLEWKPKQLKDDSSVIRLTKCSLLFEGMSYQVYSPHIGDQPVLVSEVTLSIEQVKSFADRDQNLVTGILISFPEVSFEAQPQCFAILRMILGAHISAFSGYKELLKEKMTIIQGTSTIIDEEPEEGSSMTESLVQTLSMIWQNIREPLGREIDIAATRLEWFDFCFLFENIKVALLYGIPQKNETVPVVVCQIENIDLQGVVRMKGSSSSIKRWTETHVIGTVQMKQLSLSPAFGKTFPFLSNAPSISEIVDSVRLPKISAAFKFSGKKSSAFLEIGSPKVTVSPMFLLFVSEINSLNRSSEVDQLSEVASLSSNTKKKWLTLLNKVSLILNPGTLELLGEESERFCSLPLPSWSLNFETGNRKVFVSAILAAETITLNSEFILFGLKLSEILSSYESSPKKTKPKSSSNYQITAEVQFCPLRVYYCTDTNQTTTLSFTADAGLLEYVASKDGISVSMLLPKLCISLGPMDSAAVKVVFEEVNFYRGESSSGQLSNLNVDSTDIVVNLWHTKEFEKFFLSYQKSVDEAPSYLWRATQEYTNPYIDTMFNLTSLPEPLNHSWWLKILLSRTLIKVDFGEAQFKIAWHIHEFIFRKSYVEEHVVGSPHLFCVVGRMNCNVMGGFTGNIDFDEPCVLQTYILNKINPVQIGSKVLVPYVAASDFQSIWFEEAPQPISSFQSRLLNRKGLYHCDLKIASIICNLFAEAKAGRSLLPLANLNVEGIKLEAQEAYDTVEEQLLLHGDMSISSMTLGLTIDTIGDLLRGLGRVQVPFSDNQDISCKLESLYPHNIIAQGSFNFSLHRGDFALTNGVSSNALSAAAAAFAANMVVIKWKNELIGEKLCGEVSVSFRDAWISRFQQLLANYGLSEGESSTTLNSRERFLGAQRRRRERTILSFPKTTIDISTEQFVEWKTVYFNETMHWKAILEPVIKFTFHSKFAKTISVSTDLRDYTYLRELIGLLLERVSPSSPAKEESIEYVRRGGVGDFVFEPKLNVIGDATSLALGMVLSKLNIRKTVIPQYVHSTVSVPVTISAYSLLSALETLSYILG